MAKLINKRMRHIRWMLVFYDTLIFLFASYIFLGFYRGGGILNSTQAVEHMILAAICIALPRFLGGIYSQIWRYGGVQTYMKLIITDIIGGILYETLNLTMPLINIATSRVISIVSINMLGCLIIRMTYRYAFKFSNTTSREGKILTSLLTTFAGDNIKNQRDHLRAKRKIAIVGAGRVGVTLAENLISNEDAGTAPVCFVDISPEKVGRELHGLPVLDQSKVNVQTLGEYEVDEIVFAIPTLSVDKKKELYHLFSEMGYPVKTYDFPILEKVGRKRQIKNFEIEDVLFRAPIVVTNEKTDHYYEDKVILVTGGGGSIGSELSRQVAAMDPKRLILLDIYENGVYDVQQELKMKYGKALDICVEITSITNMKGMDRIFREYRPQIVINAAAHKHVPLMEHNCVEAVYNNVFGTENVLKLCEKYHVERFMMLSTDKAVNPTNVMGSTKRMCEFLMQAYSTKGNVKCSATRFGNVLGSAGSVIPLFKRQIAQGGPVTLTDKRIIRYFMTIPEASQLVLQSGAMANNGELFVLDMGEPVKILELAENMIRLSGFVPYRDIKIEEIGLRPGEKLYEELLVKCDELEKTDNDLIFIEKEEPLTMEELEAKLQILREACASQDNELVKEALRQVVPTFKRPEEVNQKAVAEKVVDEKEVGEIVA